MQPGSEYGDSPASDLNPNGQGAERPTTWLQCRRSPSESDSGMVKPTMQRRAKRIVPEEEKDQKYWEKRQRNNLAAKRSREHKRQEEYAKQTKLQKLTEDNTILRRELMKLKQRYRLPLHQCQLTPAEITQCLQEAQTTLNAMSVMEPHGIKINRGNDNYIFPPPSVPPFSLFPTSRPTGKIPIPLGSSTSPPGVGDSHGDLNPQHGAGFLRTKQQTQAPLGYAHHGAAESFLPRISQYSNTTHGFPTPTSLWGLESASWHRPNPSFPEYRDAVDMNQHHHHQQQQHLQHQQQKAQEQQQQQQQQQQQLYEASLGLYSTSHPMKLPPISSAFPTKTSVVCGHSGGCYEVSPAIANTGTTNNNSEMNMDNNNMDSAASSKVPGGILDKGSKEILSSYNFFREAVYSSSQGYHTTPDNTTTTTTASTTNSSTTTTTLSTQPDPTPAGALARSARSLRPASALSKAGNYLKSSLAGDRQASGANALANAGAPAQLTVSMPNSLTTLQGSAQPLASGGSCPLRGSEVSVDSLLPSYNEGSMC